MEMLASGDPHSFFSQPLRKGNVKMSFNQCFLKQQVVGMESTTGMACCSLWLSQTHKASLTADTTGTAAGDAMHQQSLPLPPILFPWWCLCFPYSKSNSSLVPVPLRWQDSVVFPELTNPDLTMNLNHQTLYTPVFKCSG